MKGGCSTRGSSFTEEAMRQLAASDLLPQRAGQPVKVWVHISLAELLAMEGSTALV